MKINANPKNSGQYQILKYWNSTLLLPNKKGRSQMNTESEEQLTYIIFKDGKLVETDSESYERWIETEWEDIKLPDYVFTAGKKRFYIETMFQGALDKSEGFFPFVLLYFEDQWLDEAGESILPIDNDSFYYESYEEWKDEYEKLIDKLKKKQMEYGS